MSARTEYLPQDAEKKVFPAAGQGSAPPPNPFKLNPGQFEATLAATRAVLTDPRLRSGPKSLFTYFLEFSFVPNCGGLRAGVILAPSKFTAQMLHAKRDHVIKWRRKLAECGYIWTDRVKVPRQPGKPWTVVFVSCLVPKDSQRDLFHAPEKGRVISPFSGIFVGPDSATFFSPDSATFFSPDSATGISPDSGAGDSPHSGRLYLKDQDQRRGEGKPTPPAEAGADQNTNFQKWAAKLEKMYHRELEPMLARLKQDAAKLKADPKNRDRGPERETLKDFRAYAGQRIAELKLKKTKAAAREAQDYIDRLKLMEADESNYSPGTLNASARATLANITRKIQAVEAALR